MINIENKKTKKCLPAKVVNVLDTKTVKVRLTTSVFMSTPGKIVSIKKNILCHYDSFLKVGDTVVIAQCKPISKSKRFSVVC